MKKNIAMRVAAFLFILTMISTCAFATTFAKYTSADHAEDTARVAKWGVTVTGKKGADNSMFSLTEGNASDYSVSSSDTVKVVAPGTKGDFSEFTINGTPEVAVNVSYKSEFALTGWAITGDDFYCPIVITVNATVISGLDYATADLFIKAVDDAIKANSHDYAAGTDLSSKKTDTNLKISWSWAFEGTSAEQTDAKDTELGKLAAAGNAPKITLKVTCTVSQLDTYPVAP